MARTIVTKSKRVKRRRTLVRIFAVLSALLAIGLLLPQPVVIPVQGATVRDWHKDSFWYAPWGASGVHKGIDVFADKGTPVLATTYGVVVYTGVYGNGGRVALMLGPRWRLHYFAHLETVSVSTGQVLGVGAPIGTVGDSGNAAGKAPHLHYSIVTLVPYPWRMSGATQGWKRAFYLDPGDVLAVGAQGVSSR